MSDPATLYLVDGSNFIFRAFYGIRSPMEAPDGTPTNAVFGFLRMIIKLLRERTPSHLAIVFDAGPISFRNEIYPDYKANRSAPPPELVPQFELCREVARAAGIPALYLDNYEADDLIGTLARKWTRGAAERRCVIVTGDKDMMQLVDERTTLYDAKTKITGREEVIEKFGVPPERVTEALGLAGDSSDNIPGVPGIGVKTAMLLLRTYDSLEALLADAGNIKGKRGENLVRFADQARLSQRLATIDCDAPVELDVAALERRRPDKQILKAFLERVGFKRLLKEFSLAARPTLRALDRAGHQILTGAGDLKGIEAQIRAAGRVAVWLCGQEGQLSGIALAWAPGQVASFFAGGAPARADLLGALAPLLADPELPKIGHDLQAARALLGNLVLRGVRSDVMLEAWLLDANRRELGLAALASDQLGYTLGAPPEEAVGDKHEATQLCLPSPAETAAEAADVVLRLSDQLAPQLAEEGLERVAREIEIPLSAVLARMVGWGIRVDGERLRAQSRRFAERIAGLEAEIWEIAGETFKIGSTQQLARVLFEKLGLPVAKRTKSGYSTDSQVLEGLRAAHPLPGRVLEWRHLSKLRGTYLDPLPALIDPSTGRLHTRFHQTGAATGRISSSDPNLQNIPVRTPEGRAIRRAFVAEEGWRLLSADYSQIELRVLAHLCEDPGLVRAFTRGEDIHTATAAEVFEVAPEAVTQAQRGQSKAINFGLIYGMGPMRLAADLGIDRVEAQGIIDRYFERYPGAKSFFGAQVREARRSGETRTLFGRSRPLPDIGSTSWSARAAAERVAVNMPIQGTAADLLKLAMVRLDARLSAEGLQSRMLLTVHDELVLEVPEAELDVLPQLVREEMEGVATLRVPLVVEVGVGASWAEIH